MSFVPIASDSHFSLRNIPFGIYSTPTDATLRAGTAIGDQVLDLKALASSGAFSSIENVTSDLFQQTTLNQFAAQPLAFRRAVRARIQDLLATGSSLDQNASLKQRVFSPLGEAIMALPVFVGDYTDYCASEHHTKNLGRLIDTNSPPLPPCWIHIPIGYHGRASSIIPSPSLIHRPAGAIPTPTGPIFGPSRALDFELEMAAVVGGPSTKVGQRVGVEEVEERVFGVVIMNDWSSRDIQGFEMVPLGPHNGKNFATTISPWVVTLDALKPFKTALPPRPIEAEGTTVLPYLVESDPQSTFDINLEVILTPTSTGIPTSLSTSNLQYLSYSFGQMLAHQTVSGCPLNAGDLLGSGTITGPHPHQCGSLIEISQRGKQPCTLKDGTTRAFLNDGDTVELIAVAGKEAEGLVGFGKCVGTILPAVGF